MYPEHLHWKMDIVTLYRAYISSLVIFYSVYQYVYNKYNNEGYKAVEKIIRISSYFLLFPLFLTIFGKQLGLTDAMVLLRDYGDRQIGIFSNPNIAGLHANFTLCICLYSIISNRKGKLLWIALVPVSIYAAFLTLSKAAIICSLLLLAYFLVFLVLTFFKQRKSNRILSIATVAIFLFGSTYTYVNFYELASKMSYAQVSRLLDTIDLLSGKINSKTTSERSAIAELAFPKIKEHFLIGNGFGTFHRFIEHKGLGVHNTGLIIIGEAGIIPSLLFLAFILAYFYKALSVQGLDNKFLASSLFIAFFFIAFLTSHNALEERMSNILLGITICLISFRKPNAVSYSAQIQS